MSVWSTAVSPAVPLAGVEGALVSVTVSVEAPRLEALLDALAHLGFPVNPQIYHDAGPVGGPATLVEFPAYENHLPEIRTLLESYGFAAASVHAAAMLDSIRCGHALA
jgi:hypothetical protein